MTLAAWLHTLSPFVWRINGDFGIRWYGLAYLAGFVAAYAVLLFLSKRRLVLIPPERVGDAIMWLVLGVLVGGRLGYVLVYDQAAITSFSRSFPFWDVLAIHHGGMASHGGMVGVILAAFRISRGWKDPATGQIVGRCPLLHVADATALICPFGLFFGRLANFINGELLGAVASPPGAPGPWWSVQFPQELKGITDITPAGDITRHAPAQPLTPEQGQRLYDLLANIGPPKSSLAHRLDTLIAHARDYAPQLKSLLSSRHPSQLYQAAAEGLVVGAILWTISARPRRPGTIGAAFLISYGVLRILTEFIRLPDPQFVEGRIYGLSRGQWLSVAMIAGGLVLAIYVKLRNAPRLGGWRSSPPLNTPTPPPSL